MTEIPEFSPGCFGSALAYSEKHRMCGRCKFSEECRPLHERNLVELRNKLGVTKRAAVIEQNDLSADPKPKGAMFAPSPKAKALIERLDRGQFFVTDNLRKGKNPFDGSIPYMRIACHLLLRMKQPLSRQTLSLAFQRKLGWKENTSDSQARICIQALLHIGAVENVDGSIVLRG